MAAKILGSATLSGGLQPDEVPVLIRRQYGDRTDIRSPKFFLTAIRGDLRKILPQAPKAARSAPPESSAAAADMCAKCRNVGVLGISPKAGTVAAVRAALSAGGELCDCLVGDGWRQFLEIDAKPSPAPVVSENGGTHAHAVAV